MPKWELRKAFLFESAHQLPSHEGKCRNLHGHAWKVEIVLERSYLDPSGPSAGMVMDFYDLKKVVQPIIADLDHCLLNSKAGLENPTSEVLSFWLYRELVSKLPTLAAVIVHETDGSSCEYRP